MSEFFTIVMWMSFLVTAAMWVLSYSSSGGENIAKSHTSKPYRFAVRAWTISAAVHTVVGVAFLAIIEEVISLQGAVIVLAVLAHLCFAIRGLSVWQSFLRPALHKGYRHYP